ncbi:hypothetical protein F3087_39845 [Nocardia colli]|uniref:Uncharacterized protein n=1 Tax=Nocardia colli TaxID=2545717 RepID=A0A5N0DXX1_9NOCA|nr:hypothetical protein [Nocardia colli]KAA8881987.1 hypothetical protein F3087_39845 [Nocardia colli]
MTGSGFQRALAELLTAGDARILLDERPTELAARFGLTRTELDLLVAADRRQLDINIRSVTNKRLDMLARCLPATLSAAPHQHELLGDFIRRYPPVHVEGQQNHKRVLAEGTRFLDYLVTSGRQHMADLARYEVLRLELLYDPAATLAAEHATDDGSELGAHVRLAEFDTDVVAQHNEWMRTGEVPSDGTATPIRIALVKVAGRSALACYRLGEQAYRVLRSGAPYPPAAEPVVRFARQERLLDGNRAG